MFRIAATVLLALSALAASALAQDAGDDWDLRQDAARGLALATLEYEGAPTLAVRCLDHEMTLMVAGLPAAPDPAQSRTLSLSIAGVDRPGSWTALPGGAGVGRSVSGMMVRELMAGSEVVLTVNDTQPPRRYRLAAPVRSTALAQVLTTCGLPTTYARDAERQDQRAARGGVEPRVVLRHRPDDIQYPSRAASKGVTSGTAVVTCRVKDNGRLEACEIESETPLDAGFGEEALRAVRDFTLDLSDPHAPRSGEITSHVMRFRIQG